MGAKVWKQTRAWCMVEPTGSGTCRERFWRRLEEKMKSLRTLGFLKNREMP